MARYNGGGTFTYDPNGQFDWLEFSQQAFDTFTYVVSDGVLTDTATVTITINGIARFYLPVVSNP
jgi:VCBS repeat-containing protein